jgi:hypothetical protein
VGAAGIKPHAVSQKPICTNAGWSRTRGRIAVMRKWRVILTLNGVRTETIIHAATQYQAIMLAKAQFAGTDAHNFNAIEIH